jgi:hypothetical protein
MLYRFAVLLVLLTSLVAAPASAESSGRFQLVRSASGSRGRPENGRFLIEDPRVAFQAGKDRQVLVLFEWQGPSGHHRCQGRWKDPTGNVVYTSESNVDARGPRFGVYWGLSLPDTVATGTWVVEALVDGEPAGVHALQILKEAGAADVATRRALSLAELYQRGLRDTLTLDVTGAGRHFTSGYFVSPELVATSLAGINAADTVRLVTPDGRALETREIAGWNVHEDWALLRFAGAGGRPPSRAPQEPEVGDRMYFLDFQGGSERVIIETTLIGRSADGDLRLADVASEAGHGAPVFNEYGEMVAVLAGSGVLGAGVLDMVGLSEAGYGIQTRGSRARPAVSASAAKVPRTLEELEQSGVFVRPVVQTPHAVIGILGTRLEQRGAIPVAGNQRFRFSRSDRQCVVFVTWSPARKEDAIDHFELYDRDNRRIGGTDPKKLRLRTGRPFVQYWKIPLDPLKPGLYRVDVVLGTDPVWRSFFRLAD